jgi:DNA mismatch repair protein MutS2
MAYDLEALRPTFRPATGAPGRSYAFDIAARMGLPDALLERARALAGASSVGLESVIARLQARDAELVKQSERLAEAEAAAIAATETQREAAAALARREREIARDAVEAAVAETRAALACGARRAAGRQRARRRGRPRGLSGSQPRRWPSPAPAKPATSPSLVAGARVFVQRLNADGVVTSPDARAAGSASAR